MFERYSEAARKAIFYARREAGHYGSRSIETYMLLLGVLRADPVLAKRVLQAERLEAVELEFARYATDTKIPESMDLPLSEPAQRSLVLASKEAKIAGSGKVESVHLLAALAQDDGPAQAALARRGVDADTCRGELRRPPPSDQIEE